MRHCADERVVTDQDGRSTDTTTGVQMWRADRDRLSVELGGRHLDLYLEADKRGMTVWLPQAPAWSDGTAVSAQELSTVRGSIAAVALAWHTSVTFG